MTESYLKNITPDSLSGLIFGFEGIKHALVILNGPTGCKFYHSITADTQSLRKDNFDPLNYTEEWFFGQGRVPCTFLDKRDYVYGSEDKLTDAVRYIIPKTKPEMLAVVNTPGAALIGDDLEKIIRTAMQNAAKENETKDDKTDHNEADFDIPVITCQSPGYSKDVIDGYKEAAVMVIDKLCSGKRQEGTGSGISDDEKHQPEVNLLGLSIYQKYHTGDIREIGRLLDLCGIRVNTAFLCESTLDEIRALPDADLNIVTDPDWGLDIAEELKQRFGTPYLFSEYGYPVGFKAAEKLITDICKSLSTVSRNIDPEAALEECAKARAQSYIHISRLNSLSGLPKGAPFLVHGTPAVKRGYSAFLTEYLGMHDSSEEDADVILADGNYIAMNKAEGRRFSGIEIALPSIGYVDVIEKTHLGPEGALLLIEQILNSFVY